MCPWLKVFHISGLSNRTCDHKSGMTYLTAMPSPVKIKSCCFFSLYSYQIMQGLFWTSVGFVVMAFLIVTALQMNTFEFKVAHYISLLPVNYIFPLAFQALLEP